MTEITNNSFLKALFCDKILNKICYVKNFEIPHMYFMFYTTIKMKRFNSWQHFIFTTISVPDISKLFCKTLNRTTLRYNI